jgi:hypothetical protein
MLIDVTWRPKFTRLHTLFVIEIQKLIEVCSNINAFRFSYHLRANVTAQWPIITIGTS